MLLLASIRNVIFIQIIITIIELGWKDVRSVYVYNISQYVDDYDVDDNFPDDNTYTLSLRHISEIYGNCEEFAAAMHSGQFVYVDGHVVLNREKYITRLNGIQSLLLLFPLGDFGFCVLSGHECISYHKVSVRI